MEQVKLIECPRDAWQGLKKIIPAEAKAAYLRKLLGWGFRHLDAVSFVSPRAVPQTADSERVMEELVGAGAVPARTAADAAHSDPEIIAIIANRKGLDRALAAPGVTTLGYPHSISPRFLRQNNNLTPEESRARVEEFQPAAQAAGRRLVVYISMAFGNPYGEPWSAEQVLETLDWLKRLGVETVSLADTVGLAAPERVGQVFAAAPRQAAGMEVGIHLHSRRANASEKVLAAFEAGCRRFDCALTGLGGCPFAGDEMVGNIPTEIVSSALAERGAETGLEPWAVLAAVEAAREFRRQYADSEGQ